MSHFGSRSLASTLVVNVLMFLALVLALLCLNGCGGTSTTGGGKTLSSIAISAAASSIATGATDKFTATGTYSDHSTADLTNSATWSSSNTATATITSAGLATGIAAGTTNVAASSNGVTSPPTSITVTASLAITQLSTTSPTALTPLQISTSGLSSNTPTTITFSNGSGFSVTEPPLRVASDGTVIAAVPLFTTVNGQTGSGSVSVSLAQGSVSSAPVPLTIQDLPSASSYGMQPGQISHGFLVYEAMRVARHVNELQAFQYLPGNTVDTTQAQATLTSMLHNLLVSRNDIDRVALDSSLTISAGSLSDGTPLQFDQTSLDMMDRMVGLYISTQMAPVISSAQQSLSKERKVRSRKKHPMNYFQLVGPLSPWQLPMRRLGTPRSDTYFAPEACGSSTMCSWVNFIESANNLTGITQATSDLVLKQDPSAFDNAIAIQGGLVSLYGLAGSPGISKVPWVGPALGAIVSGETLLNAFGQELGDLAFIMVASRNGTDPQVIQQAWNDIHDQGITAGIATLQTELSLVQFGGEAEIFAADAVSVLTSGAGQLALQSAQLIAGLANCATTECINLVYDVSTQIASDAQNIFSSAAQGFAEVTGLADVTYNNQDPSFDSESGISIGPFEGNQQIDSIADSSGNYDMFVPLQVTGTDYGTLNANLFDWITGTNLASEPVNLLGLTTDAPSQLTTMQATCNDTDAGNPDEDDPDCD